MDTHITIPMARLVELETAEHERDILRTENAKLAREAHTWSKAAETYAAELERHKPLLQAVEWLLDDGHMNTEHLARLRSAWEVALGPNV